VRGRRKRVFNATGIRVRDWPITLDKLLPRLSPVALVSAGENP
jgi:hypothetical protein